MAVRAGQEPVFRRQREPDRVVETQIVRPLHEVLDNSPDSSNNKSSPIVVCLSPNCQLDRPGSTWLIVPGEECEADSGVRVAAVEMSFSLQHPKEVFPALSPPLQWM